MILFQSLKLDQIVHQMIETRVELKSAAATKSSSEMKDKWPSDQ
jgi:hypothetical protein